MPLFPVSPERENRKHPSYQLPPSPSLPSVSPTRGSDYFSSHTRSGSDVQGKVAQFNNLTKEAAQRRKDNEAALKRAMLGREEAENETRRLKDENDALRREIEEGRGRERKVGERLESVMEDLQRAKETQTQAQTVYEKEVRRARKEAFKSSSALVKLQEELKTARNRYTLMRVEADEQRQKASAKEQETYVAQQQLVLIQEELDTLKRQRLNTSEQPAPGQDELIRVHEELFTLERQLKTMERRTETEKQRTKIVEEERDALKQSMKEEEVARSAALGAIALPPSREGARATFGSPRKSRQQDRDSRKHYREYVEGTTDSQGAEGTEELSQLRNELHTEKRMRLQAEEQVHLSQMECQFGCCPCKLAENKGCTFVHDKSQAEDMAQRSKMAQMANMAKMAAASLSRGRKSLSEHTTPNMDRHQQSLKLWDYDRPATEPVATVPMKSVSEINDTMSDASRYPSAAPGQPPFERQISEELIDPSLKTDADNQGMFAIDPSLSSPAQLLSHPTYPTPHAHPGRPDSRQYTQPPSPTLQNMDFNFTEIIPNIPSIPCPLPTPPPPALTLSTTMQIPLKDDLLFSPAPATSGGISREEALEQIRARRGRARSYAAAHPASATPKRGILGTPRREISAPASRRVG